MSPRAELALHSIVSVILCMAAVGTAIGAGYWLADLQGLSGNARDRLMIGVLVVGLAAGVVVIFAYRQWLLPRRLRNIEVPVSPERRAQELYREQSIAAMEAWQEALRQELRATPGLERYAELVGRSAIGTVEDARVREARVAELRADPVKSKYAERVFNGEAITDRMIAYLEDSAARVLCDHLAALEADVRKADPHAAPSDEGTLESNLGFDFDAVKRLYALGDPVTFWRREFGPQYHGRGEDNYDGAERIECTQHRCALNGCEFRRNFP
jgi:hypothetical protein